MGTNVPLQGGIENTGYVDLTGIADPKELEGITQIANTGVVLVREDMASAVAKIPMRNVGQVVSVPAGKRVSIRAGIVQMSGAALENADGDAGDILVLVGQTVINGVPAKVGYELVVVGMVILPFEAQDMITRAITKFAGQAMPYRGKTVRTFTSDVTFDREFLELLPDETALLLMSDATIESDVTKELLQAKVSDILHMSDLYVPKHLRAMVQVLATTSMGEILVQNEESRDDG